MRYKPYSASKKDKGRQTKQSITFANIASRAILSVFATIILLGFYTPAHAGIFSLVKEIFGSPAKAFYQTNKQSTKNSQTIPLLSAAINANPSPNTDGPDTSIVDQSALIAQGGPFSAVGNVGVRVPQSDQISLYVVREGDTLSQIAAMFDVTTNTIKWANDIQSASVIQPGQTLVILPISGVRHTVKDGDTLASIAKKYGGSIGEIALYNTLAKTDELKVGEEIVIPDGEITSPVYATTPRRIAPSGGADYAGNSSTGTSFTRPIDGGVRTQGIHGYNGVDLAAPIGTPIYAAASGDVIISKNSGWNGGYGRYIVIKHGNGVQTLYSHNSENVVSVGQSVSNGQVIGYIGQSGKATGPHVHFEVRGAANPF